ncbi:MAG: hypothetical protein AB8H03_00845 [Saprospiraceae bacterium]
MSSLFDATARAEPSGRVKYSFKKSKNNKKLLYSQGDSKSPCELVGE